MNITFPASDHEFMYLSKEYQGNKSMGQFMRELHEPIEIMPAFQDGKNYQKENNIRRSVWTKMLSITHD